MSSTAWAISLPVPTLTADMADQITELIRTGALLCCSSPSAVGN